MDFVHETGKNRYRGKKRPKKKKKQVGGDQMAMCPKCLILEAADFLLFLQQRGLMVPGVLVTPAG